MNMLPEIFRPILWSYDFDKCDPQKMKDTIIKQTINYGDLSHFKWVRSFYGVNAVMDVINKSFKTEIHEKSLHLARLLFS